jgi:plasmid stability protein
MSGGYKVAPKKKQAVSAHDLDRIIVRLPPGMREKLGERAVENGRSMTAEVVAALTEHLRRKDRLSALEGQLEAMQGNINRVWHHMMDFAKRLDEKTNNPPG